MKRLHFILVFNIGLLFSSYSQQTTIQEKLGYPENTKLLIIHADDFGVCHSENAATIKTMEVGIVNSTSIMVPCPWFYEAAAYAKSHPDADIGLHLTLTSEWQYYKWGPILPEIEVPSLITDKGYFYELFEDAGKDISEKEVEKELRAQIERALEFGINPTHFDSHMFTLLEDVKFLKVYLKLSREYKVPILLNNDYFATDINPYLQPDDIVVDNLYMGYEEVFDTGLEAYYIETLKSLKAGLNVLLVHPAYDNNEMKAISADGKYWGGDWRQKDFDFLTSDTTRKLIEDEKIQLITWREIREKLLLNNPL